MKIINVKSVKGIERGFSVFLELMSLLPLAMFTLDTPHTGLGSHTRTVISARFLRWSDAARRRADLTDGASHIG